MGTAVKRIRPFLRVCGWQPPRRFSALLLFFAGFLEQKFYMLTAVSNVICNTIVLHGR